MNFEQTQPQLYRAEGYRIDQAVADPYVVVFISLEQYEELLQEIELADRESLLDTMAVVLDGVSAFTADGDALIGPSTYARGVGVRLDYPMMDV